MKLLNIILSGCHASHVTLSLSKCLFFLLLLPFISNAQAPSPQAMPPYYINDLDISTGTELYESETIISTGDEAEPVDITDEAEVDFKASKEVELKPGFTASDFTGDGEFHAYIDELPFEVAWFEPVDDVGTVPKYEKLELGIKLPDEIQQNIDDFLDDPTYPITPTGNQINPYDPAQISVEINFTSPDNRQITKYGFYYKEFNIQTVNSYTQNAGETFTTFWFDGNQDYHFRIRFTPDYIGKWTYKITILQNGNNAIGTYSGSFNCATSANKGYLEASSNNKYLRFKDNHESFFAIGENLAFPFHNFMLTPSIEDRMETLTTQLSDYGGNYFRIWMATWALGVERERLGVYDKGNYDIGA